MLEVRGWPQVAGVVLGGLWVCTLIATLPSLSRLGPRSAKPIDFALNLDWRIDEDNSLLREPLKNLEVMERSIQVNLGSSISASELPDQSEVRHIHDVTNHPLLALSDSARDAVTNSDEIWLTPAELKNAEQLKASEHIEEGLSSKSISPSEEQWLTAAELHALTKNSHSNQIKNTDSYSAVASHGSVKAAALDHHADVAGASASIPSLSKFTATTWDLRYYHGPPTQITLESMGGCPIHLPLL